MQVWFLWTYLFFMSAWLLGKHVLPAIIPLWSPAWTPGITNVRLTNGTISTLMRHFVLHSVHFELQH